MEKITSESIANLNSNLIGPFYIGVDVGTGSVRAGLFDQNGKMISTSTQSIITYQPQDDYFE